MQMEIGFASRVERWKAELWGRKITLLKGQNDSLAGDLKTLRGRLTKLDQEKTEATLKLEFTKDMQVPFLAILISI